MALGHECLSLTNRTLNDYINGMEVDSFVACRIFDM